MGLHCGTAISPWPESLYSEIRLPFAQGTVDSLQRAFSFHASFFPNVLFYQTDGTEIRIWQEKELLPALQLAHLTEKDAEECFVQVMVSFLAAQKLGLSFLDFSRWQISAEKRLSVPLSFSPSKNKQGVPLLEQFQRHGRLLDLNEEDYLNNWEQRRGRFHWRPASFYLYRGEELACNLLSRYSLRDLRLQNHMRIRISLPDETLKAVVEKYLFHAFQAVDIAFWKIDLKRSTMADYFSAVCGLKRRAVLAPEAVIAETVLLWQRSPWQKVLLLIDGLQRQEDVEFAKQLLDLSGIPLLIMVVFGQENSLPFDLEFHENPANLLADFLPLSVPEEEGCDRKELSVLKVLQVLGMPLADHWRNDLFSPGERSALVKLIARQYVKEDGLRHTLVGTRFPSCLSITAEERKHILRRLAEKMASLPVQIRYYLETADAESLLVCLRAYGPRASGDPHVRYVAEALCSKAELFGGNRELLRAALEILLQANCLRQATQLLQRHESPNSPYLHVKMAQLAKLLRNPAGIGEWLAGIKRVPPDLEDEWQYLQFFFEDKQARPITADAHLRKIRSPFFRHLAQIQRSEREIYGGNVRRAREWLLRALEFFRRERAAREELETQSQLAKLCREEGKLAEAERLYRTIFVHSESLGLGLLAASIAVDFGNLWLKGDDLAQAESWYRKAARLYATEKNIEGQMLANGNLFDIHLLRGEWGKAEKLLKTVLAFDKKSGSCPALAVDYFNLAFLAYRRHQWAKALKTAERACSLFQRIGNRNGVGESLLLKNRVLFLQEQPLDIPKSSSGQFSARQRQLLRILSMFSTARINSAQEFCRQVKRLASASDRFEMLCLGLQRWKSGVCLVELQKEVKVLANQEKNYYYHECQYWHFTLPQRAEEMTSELKERFYENFDFFQANQRVLAPEMISLKEKLDEIEVKLDIFANARLVESFRKWQSAEDFFASFVREIQASSPVELVKMTVLERGHKIFQFGDSELFSELSDEVFSLAMTGEETLSFSIDEIRATFHSTEKMLYPYSMTKVVLWQIGTQVRAWLLLASSDRKFAYMDFYDRNREIFQQFSFLFLKYYENDFQIDSKLESIVGQAESIQQLKQILLQVSKVDFAVLITGESGCGKELVARAVHRLSARADGPFVSVNAAAIPENLLEAEFFGYKKGAFTGASEARTGLIEAAHKGVLFLDEIADLPLSLQAKLLRVLQEGEIRRLGENRLIKVDVRFVSASNRDLPELIRRGLFREDLYYRLQDITIRVPPLRQRLEDLPLLVDHFLHKYGYVADLQERERLLRHCQSCSFPGNVRELESKIKNFITFRFVPDVADESAGDDCSLKNARERFDKLYLRRMLAENGWNKAATARQLGISRMNLFNLIRKYRLVPDEALDN